jgi:hypothetical protein
MIDYEAYHHTFEECDVGTQHRVLPDDFNFEFD